MSEIKIESGAIDPSGCIGQGWELVKSDYGIFILITFLFLVTTIATSFIPYVGGIVNILITAPLLCGIYLALLMKRRGEIISVSNLFEGFRYFLPAVVVTLIPIIPSLIFGLAVGLMAGATNIFTSQNSGIPQGFSALLIVSALIVYLFVFFLQILLFFALPLIVEHNVGIGDAIKLSVKGSTQNIGGLILLFLLEGLILIAGFIALCIGILFVLPIIYAANIAAYKSVFPDVEGNNMFNQPPSPDFYNGTFGRT